MRVGLVVAAIVASQGVATTRARADEGAPEAPPSPQTLEAREVFVKGSDLVKRARWAEALDAFERSAKLRPHPVTTYNIGVCHRALGSYTLARATFQRALDQRDGGDERLPESLATNVGVFVDEIDRLLVTAKVKLEPATAAIAIDGRPLEKATNGELVAGLRAPGRGEAPPKSEFVVRMNPGAHVITFARQGYADAVVNRTFAPGTVTELTLALDRLPATLRISSEPSGAIVRVAGVDIGATPVDVPRPAGSYPVKVTKLGYLDFEARVDARPGEEVKLRAPLSLVKPALTSKWWFWAGIGVAVAGAATATYFIAVKDPEPTRPAYDGGSLGWVLKLPAQ